MHTRPRGGSGRRATSESIARGTFALIVLALAASGIVTVCAFRAAADADWWVRHTLAVEKDLSALSSTFGAFEAVDLDRLITHLPTTELDRLQAESDERIGAIASLTADNPHQREQVPRLRSALSDAFSSGRSLLEVERKGGIDAARSVLLGLKDGHSKRRAVDSLIEEMTQEEEGLLRARTERALGSAVRAAVLAGGFGVLALFVMVAGYARIRRDSRARQRALDEVAQSEQDLATTLRSIGDGVIATDRSGRITRMNAVAEKLTGWTAAAATGQVLDDVFCLEEEATRAKRQSPVERVLRGSIDPGGSDAVLLVHKDGTSRPIADGGAPIRVEGEDARGVVIVFRDISDERDAMRSRERSADVARRAQIALGQSQARLAALSHSGILGIIVSSLDDSGVVEINDALLAALGYEREEIVSGRVPWASLTPPEWHDVDVLALAALHATGVSALREKEFLRKDGVRVPVMCGTTVLPGGDHECISFVLDLRINKEAALAVEHLRESRASETLFRGLLEAAPDAVVIVASDNKITRVNEQTERLFGYGRDELVGQDAAMLVPERLALRYAADRARYAATEHAVALSSDHELLGRRRDGTEFPIEISRGRLQMDKGTLICCAIRDVTQRRKIEAALTAANAELESFSYSVAHDLRAPLRGMNGFAQLLLTTYKDKLDAEGQDWLHEVLLNANKMGSLIDALLALGRVTRSELHVERVDLSALAGDLITELAALEPSRKVDVEIEPEMYAEMDARLAKALLANLLGNAWKFTAKAKAARIDFASHREEGVRQFFVRDNGAGFEMAYASKLFTPFHRLHTEAEFTGTGIGLATVQRILHRHGGRIRAEGIVEGGATFSFSLPRGALGVAPS